MTETFYLICIGLIDQGEKRIMPIGGKSIGEAYLSDSKLEVLFSPIALELLVRIIQRSQEGSIKAAASDKSILIVKIPMNSMQEDLPSLKRDWIQNGNTEKFLRDLRKISKRIWSTDFVRYEGLEFREIKL